MSAIAASMIVCTPKRKNILNVQGTKMTSVRGRLGPHSEPVVMMRRNQSLWLRGARDGPPARPGIVRHPDITPTKSSNRRGVTTSSRQKCPPRQPPPATNLLLALHCSLPARPPPLPSLGPNGNRLCARSRPYIRWPTNRSHSDHLSCAIDMIRVIPAPTRLKCPQAARRKSRLAIRLPILSSLSPVNPNITVISPPKGSARCGCPRSELAPLHMPLKRLQGLRSAQCDPHAIATRRSIPDAFLTMIFNMPGRFDLVMSMLLPAVPRTIVTIAIRFREDGNRPWPDFTYLLTTALTHVHRPVIYMSFILSSMNL